MDATHCIDVPEQVVLAPRARAGLSIAEIVLAALILAVSGVAVMELVRSSTVNLEVTQTEAAARALGASILERMAAPPMVVSPGVGKLTQSMLGSPIPWAQLVKDDPALALAFPFEALGPVLDLADTHVALKVQHPYSHPALGAPTSVDCYSVTVFFRDQDDHQREVTFARLVDRD